MKRIWLWLFVLVVLVGGVMLAVGRACGRHAGGFFGPAGVAVIRLEVKIFQNRELLEQIHAAETADHVKAVVLRVDSPGGAVGASQELYLALKQLRTKKPLVASFATVAASGGYYAGMAALPIFVLPGTVTGSIGVRMMHVDVGDLLHWALIQPSTLKSGTMKAIGDPIRALTPEERTFLESLLQNMHAQFIRDVAAARGLDETIVKPLADGRIYTGEQAMQHRLVDRVGTFYDAVADAAAQAGLSGEPKLLEYDTGRGVLDRLRAEVVTPLRHWLAGGTGALPAVLGW